LQADGGWRRIVWMSKNLKERVKEGIPEEIYSKIATDEDARDISSLKEFLLEVDHPVVEGVVRPVDDKKITEGWKLEEVTDEDKQRVISFIEETGGEFTSSDIRSKLRLSEGQLMQVVEVLQEEGILE
jgi:acetyl-CoA decarbonylase/synthase complex subunit beta